MIRDKGIVINKSNWKESSFLVSFFCQNHGNITAIVQGAKKPKSPYFAHYEKGNILEVIFTKKPTASLYKLTASTVLESYDSIPKSYTQLLAIDTILEIYTQLMFSEDESSLFFELLRVYLDYIVKVSQNHLLVIWRFLVRLTEEMGFPIVVISDNSYQICDKTGFLARYDIDFIQTVESWLRILPATSRIINTENILNPTCKVMNTFFFDWFESHLNKKIYHKALKLYEDAFT